MNPSDYSDYAAYGESFALLLDGQLDAEQGRALERKLADDSQLRRFYFEYVKVHTLLQRELVGQGQEGETLDPARTLDVIFGESDSRSGVEREATITPASVSGGVAGRRQTQRQARHAQPSTAFRLARTCSMAAVIALVLLSAYGLWSSFNEVELPTLAHISGSHDAYWETTGDRGQVMPGDLVSGELLLRAGQLEMTFTDGTVATLDAPSEINLISASHMRLTRGRVYVIAPDGASGFRVSTPGAVATDLGTEFGVIYSHDFVTEVHVFKGAVSMAPARRTLSAAVEPTDRAVELHEGDSGRILPDASMQQGLQADAALFVRDVDALASAITPKAATGKSWLSYRDRLLSDPSLIACYDFMRQDNDPSELKNIAYATGSQLDGELGTQFAPETRPRWVRGRFPGRHALWFTPSLKQFVMLPKHDALDISGDMTAVWWMKPVHTYNRDYGMVVLGNGSPRSDHEAELEADNHYYAFGLKMGKIRALHESGAGVNQEVLTSQEVQPERWTHVAIVRDSRKHVYNLYIDGELSDSISYPSNVTGGNSPKSAVTLGRSGGATLNHYDGLIDELLIYSRPLSSQEVAELYQRSRPANQ